MGLITPDFSDVKDNVGPGTYKVRIVDAKVDSWQGKDGKPDTTYVNWSLETFEEAESKNNGRRLFHKTPVNGGGAFRLQQFYKAAMKKDLAGGFDTEEMLGKELEVTVVDGMDKMGNPTGYTDIKTVRPVISESK